MERGEFIESHVLALAEAGLGEARLVLRQLLAHRLDVSFAQILAEPERPIPPEIQTRLEQDLAQLKKGVPPAYVFGEVPFLDWSFTVDRRVLIPRPETEALADEILRWLKNRPPASILDLCCGSGVLGISAALQFPKARLVMTDICADALAVAQHNLERHQLEDRAECRQGDLWQAIETGERFDLIVANPPYVAEEDLVEPSVLTHEPAHALHSGNHGTAHIHAILMALDEHLYPGGRAGFELGHHHEQTLFPLLGDHEFQGQFQWGKDPFGVVRYLFYHVPVSAKQ